MSSLCHIATVVNNWQLIMCGYMSDTTPHDDLPYLEPELDLIHGGVELNVT
jgi:hypothetical protein